MGRPISVVYALPAFEVGDRVAWNTPHISQSISYRTQGEIVRIDYVKGVIAQYIVFNDYGDYTKISGIAGRYLRIVPLRSLMPRENMDLGPGSVVLHCGEELVVSEVLPNNFLLFEPPRRLPVEREYVRPASGTRRRKNFKVWSQEDHPCRLTIPRARIDPRSRRKVKVDKVQVLVKKIVLDLQGYGPFDFCGIL